MLACSLILYAINHSKGICEFYISKYLEFQTNAKIILASDFSVKKFRYSTGNIWGDSTNDRQIQITVQPQTKTDYNND